jgi:membrane peptidoglycan carboxypeptidase
MGYTPQYVTGVWAGNNDNTSMNAGGSTVAAPIWDEFMERIHRDLPVEQFPRPDGVDDFEVARYSNLIPTDATTERIRDLLTSWQKPTDRDTAFIKVRVCRENGLLADDSIPNELTEERTYINIRSEKPDDPRWENPVRAWAQANGFTNTPPTEKCQADSSQPNVDITAPANNATVSGNFTISANATAPSGVRNVEFTIDGNVIATDTEAPYSTSYNANNLSPGVHTVRVLMTSNNGSTRSDQISVNVVNDTTPPGEVTGFSGSQLGLPSGSVKLSWINPSDSDFKSVKIYTYKGAPAFNILDRVNEILKPGQTITLTGLTPGQYKFIAKTTDNAGNESAGVFIILTIQ